jgi:drug/metabolite transporter (DMT)-like permease
MMSERVLGLITAVLLFIAVAHLPIGYYTFLRIAVTLSTGYLAFTEHRRVGLSIWVLLLGSICILFNPLVPIYLGSRSAWQPIDIGAGLVLLVYVALGSRRDEGDENKPD